MSFIFVLILTITWKHATAPSGALEIIHKELGLTMAFCGHTRIGNVNQGILLPSAF